MLHFVNYVSEQPLYLYQLTDLFPPSTYPEAPHVGTILLLPLYTSTELLDDS